MISHQILNILKTCDCENLDFSYVLENNENFVLFSIKWDKTKKTANHGQKSKLETTSDRVVKIGNKKKSPSQIRHDRNRTREWNQKKRSTKPRNVSNDGQKSERVESVCSVMTQCNYDGEKQKSVRSVMTQCQNIVDIPKPVVCDRGVAVKSGIDCIVTSVPSSNPRPTTRCTPASRRVKREPAADDDFGWDSNPWARKPSHQVLVSAMELQSTRVPASVMSGTEPKRSECVNARTVEDQNRDNTVVSINSRDLAAYLTGRKC